MQIRLLKRLHMFHAITLLEAAKAKWPATQPPTPRVSWGLIVCVFTFAQRWACPRPKRFPIPYYHVMNINTQGRILHWLTCTFINWNGLELFLRGYITNHLVTFSKKFWMICALLDEFFSRVCLWPPSLNMGKYFMSSHHRVVSCPFSWHKSPRGGTLLH